MPAEANSNGFRLSSSVFGNNQPIPAIYTCKGQNIQPPLAVSNVPPESKSLAIIMRDPDAVNGEWIHWLIWNIQPTVGKIDENSTPIGAVEGTTSFGKPGYGGPCPPAGTGTHHYFFEFYALDNELDLPTSADRAGLEKAIEGHVIAHTQLIGLFGD